MGPTSTWRALFGHFLLAAMLMSITACGGDSAQSVDCNARMRFQGVTYEMHGAVMATPPGPTSPVGEADILGCTDDGWKVVGQTTALKIQGVDVKTAIAVTGNYADVYVAKGTSPDDWPDTIRRK